MPSSGVTRKNENQRIRQENLRKQLAGQGHVQHLVDIANKLRDLDPKNELDSLAIQRLRGAADIHKGLVDKYLPTLKQVDSKVDMTIADVSDSELDARLDQIIAALPKSGVSGTPGGEGEKAETPQDSDILP